MRYYLATSTDQQLGKVWYLDVKLWDMPVELQDTSQPAELHANPIKEDEDPKSRVIMKHLRNVNKAVMSEPGLVSKPGSGTINCMFWPGFELMTSKLYQM